MKAAALVITLFAVATVIQPTVSWSSYDDYPIRCSRNETIKYYAGACDECRCAHGGRPRVCTLQLIIKGCFCKRRYCRTTDGKKCVLKSECY
uniref:TIL domain containing protein n=1 Tax=Rhipicephalus appendiculatus TaxID=34631 RepID=A0A131YGE1_RHIAP